jgi:hypothetical protein
MNTTQDTLSSFSGDLLIFVYFRRELLNRASSANTTCSKGFGLTEFLVPPTKWISILAHGGHQDPTAFTPLPHPGERLTATTQFPAWKADLDIFTTQRKDVNDFKNLLRRALDLESLLAIETDGGEFRHFLGANVTHNIYNVWYIIACRLSQKF